MSYQKNDGCSHVHPSFFWYDNAWGLQGPFSVTRLIFNMAGEWRFSLNLKIFGLIKMSKIGTISVVNDYKKNQCFNKANTGLDRESAQRLEPDTVNPSSCTAEKLCVPIRCSPYRTPPINAQCRSIPINPDLNCAFDRHWSTMIRIGLEKIQ